MILIKIPSRSATVIQRWECLPVHQRIKDLIPSWGHIYGLQVWSLARMRVCEGGNQFISLSHTHGWLSLFSSLFFSSEYQLKKHMEKQMSSRYNYKLKVVLYRAIFFNNNIIVTLTPIQILIPTGCPTTEFQHRLRVQSHKTAPHFRHPLQVQVVTCATGLVSISWRLPWPHPGVQLIC